MNIDTWYKNTLVRLLKEPVGRNKRTGEDVMALPGVTFQTDLEHGFPLLSLRSMPLSFAPEQVWFLSGSDNVGWLSRHTKIWDSFAEPDGTVTSAYGGRWRKWLVEVYLGGGMRHGELDQLQEVMDKLKEDPSTRHGVVMSWSPYPDLIAKQKNVPCPVMFTLMIIGGRLHMHLVMRSNDMVLGFPTDVAGFALLQMILAQELGVEAGVYTHSISNCHMYAMHDEVAREMLRRKARPSMVGMKLPKDCYKRARALDDSLVAEIKAGLTGYAPHPAIKGIKIAL